jgi:hypothetical protein
MKKLLLIMLVLNKNILIEFKYWKRNTLLTVNAYFVCSKVNNKFKTYIVMLISFNKIGSNLLV